MRLFWRKRAQVGNGLQQAVREREAAERRLAHDEQHVIIPLRELRERNHVSEVISALIQRRAQQGGERDSGTAHP
jgi:hypothetical protein